MFERKKKKKNGKANDSHSVEDCSLRYTSKVVIHLNEMNFYTFSQ